MPLQCQTVLNVKIINVNIIVQFEMNITKIRKNYNNKNKNNKN